MKLKYFILFILVVCLYSEEYIVQRDYTENGRLDALIDDSSNPIYLIQLDVLNDSLFNFKLYSMLTSIDIFLFVTKFIDFLFIIINNHDCLYFVLLVVNETRGALNNQRHTRVMELIDFLFIIINSHGCI